MADNRKLAAGLMALTPSARQDLAQREEDIQRGKTVELLRRAGKEMYENPIVNTAISLTPGAGDIGQVVRQDPSKMDDYIKVYQDIQPVIDNDLVTTGHVPFTIVHQWDRVPAIKELVMKKYG